MWTDASADPPRCPGSGGAAGPADPSPDGWPHGRALCPRCLRFVPLEDGRLIEHETASADDTPGEVERRNTWLNEHGW